MNKKLNIITFLLILILIFTIASWLDDINEREAFAELSDETSKIVEKLRWKHSSFIYVTDDTLYYRPVEYEWLSISFEDGKLFVETQDGKWYIEMKEVKE